MLQSNKKALSEVVAYTLLIVISISLAVGVYSFLKVYLPSEKAACDQDIAIIIDKYDCQYANDDSLLNITFLNKGLFKVEGVLVRIGAENSKARRQISSEITNINLTLEKSVTKILDHIPSDFIPSAGNYILEIQPVQVISGKPVACSNAIVTQLIKCE